MDVAFLIDLTSSMGPYIKGVKQNVRSFVESIYGTYHGISLRLAFIGYRDHSEGDEGLFSIPFTLQPEEFYAVLESAKPKGGKDDAEDVFGGLQVVLSLEWKSTVRYLYHIADSPCHGSRYHTPTVSDDFPDGDSFRPPLETLMKGIVENCIQYSFAHINNTTDKMIEVFNSVLPRRPDNRPYISKERCNQLSIMVPAKVKVHEAVHRSEISQTVRSNVRKIKYRKNITTSKETPNWNKEVEFWGNCYKLIMPSSIEDLLNNSSPCVSSRVHSSLSFKWGKLPFSCGSARAAYLALFSDESKEVMVKKSLAESKQHRKWSDYVRTLRCHRAAQFLAEQFVQKLRPDSVKIRYCWTDLIELTRGYCDTTVLIREELIGTPDSEFQKYNSNGGYYMDNASGPQQDHSVVQAFSHWTYHITNGALMIMDCQGKFIQEENCFVLTDPAVNSRHWNWDEGTNMGANGMRSFFLVHRCNSFCRELRLPGGLPEELKPALEGK